MSKYRARLVVRGYLQGDVENTYTPAVDFNRDACRSEWDAIHNIWILPLHSFTETSKKCFGDLWCDRDQSLPLHLFVLTAIMKVMKQMREMKLDKRFEQFVKHGKNKRPVLPASNLDFSFFSLCLKCLYT